MVERGENVVQYQEPFYSNPQDAPVKPRVFAGMEFNVPVLEGNSTLKQFQGPQETKGIVSCKDHSFYPFSNIKNSLIV